MTTARTLVAPTVHLTGTAKEDLLEAIELAYVALNTATDALRKTAPNGRDYYVQGPDRINLASAQHCDRLRRIDSVRDELEAITCAILDDRIDMTVD